MKLFRKSNSAVTLMELILVMAIVAILVSGTTLTLRSFNRRAQDKSAMIMLRLALAAADVYRAERGSYPVASDFSILINGLYIQDPNVGSKPPRGWNYSFSGSTNSVTITATGAIGLNRGRQFTLTKTIIPPVSIGAPATASITCTGPSPWGSTWY